MKPSRSEKKKITDFIIQALYERPDTIKPLWNHIAKECLTIEDSTTGAVYWVGDTVLDFHVYRPLEVNVGLFNSLRFHYHFSKCKKSLYKPYSFDRKQSKTERAFIDKITGEQN